MDSKKKQWAIQLTGLLTAIYTLLTSLNLHFDWFTTDSINAFVAVFVALAAFAGTLYPAFKNTFLFKNGKQQAKLIQESLKNKQEKDDKQ
ncbi:hypothetical protein [Listeria seeligeri]|uniref:hypothetical protein n=1 Tax=Listeria seeligeri TaxID=1640 RepID=UPI0022EA2A94|nr:hypothetical protein [Listeria seeligeri]